MDLKYSEILKINNELEEKIKSKIYNISILSNITINQTKEILEYSLRKENVNAKVKIGDYDNIVQDSLKYKNSNLVVIFWELCNLIDGLQYKIELLDEIQFDELLAKIKLDISLVLKNLNKTSLVLFNKFTSETFSSISINTTKFERFAYQLNKFLETKVTENVKFIDINQIIANIGLSKSIDLRYYYSSKALYSISFFKSYAMTIKPFIMSATGKSKKAVIFDCDNTLWKGILGEDGFNEIEMSPSTKDGAIFSEVQSIALALSKQGILIGLCSKNNLSDVNEVINSHPDMLLRDKYITINKSNWSDKVTNLRQIAKELNIGLDSIVFVDDSVFEVNLVKEQIPEVTVLQVPKLLYEYPKMIRSNLGLFYNLSMTKEDTKKIEMYKQQVERESIKSEFANIDDYLDSLKLKMTIYENDNSIIPRMSQMSQKTNQFNLTTKRYTERDIEKFVSSEATQVFAFSVSDKFGDSGVTGLCIIQMDKHNRIANIDTFLMSCRIIGRNIEYAFMDYLIKFLMKNKIEKVSAKFIKSLKNDQTKDFFDNCSFLRLESNSTETKYNLSVSDYKSSKIKYIAVIDGE